MRLNPRLHSLERRLQTEEDRSAQRMSEIERVSMIQSAKLGIALVLMRADCARGEGEDIGAVEDLLAAMPEELEAVLRRQLAELPPGAIDTRRAGAAVDFFLPLSEELVKIIDAYHRQGFARLRADYKQKPIFNQAEEQQP